jgi:hypothetical protein
MPSNTAVITSYSVIASLFIAYFVALNELRRRKLIAPFTYKAIFALYIMQVAAVLLYVYTHNFAGGFWRWMGDFSYGEFNAAATFGAMITAVASFVFVCIALFAQPLKTWQRAHWLFLAAVFLYFSADEYFMLHEQMGNWVPYYVAGGLVFGFSTLAVFWFGYPREHLPVMVGILGGVAVAASGGVGLEVFVERFDCFDLWTYEDCRTIPPIEETLENLGFSIVLLTGLFFAEKRIPAAKWRTTAKIVTALGATWLVIMIVTFWVVPSLEARYAANRADIEYPGRLTVVAYRTSPAVLRPGDTLRVDIYAHTNEMLPWGYGFSSHVLAQPEVSSVGQADMFPVDPPIDAWLPGHITRTPLFITLPEEIAPGEYWVTFTLWYEDNGEYVMQQDFVTELDAVTPESIVLGSVSVVSSGGESR